MQYKVLQKTGIRIPPIIFGTSCLGNLYQALDDDIKLQTLQEIFNHMDDIAVLDSAGKYGAGLALEVLGRDMKTLGIRSDQVIISNKLGWYRVPLKSDEPTFEPGAWKGIEHDAIQKISYKGILECWEQGCELLGDSYIPQMVSVHDPDEYLAAAVSRADRVQRLNDVIEAYRALVDLRNEKKTKAVGIGAKNWKIIREIDSKVEFDWVMFGNSLTIYHHPPELLDFIDELHEKGIGIINSAVFHAGFLTGGRYFDYKLIDPKEEEYRPVFEWREKFFKICDKHDVSPAEACVSFGLSHPGVLSIALNTSKPERIKQNINLVSAIVPKEFWQSMKAAGLISGDYKYV